MRTKIIATLGPASMDYDIMKGMAQNGVRIFRLNFSHADAAFFEPVVKRIRQLEAELGIPLTAMADLCGPKLRIGEIKGSPVQIEKGSHVALGLPGARDKTDLLFIGLDMPELLKGLQVGMPVSLSDGMLNFIVTRVVEEDVLFEMEARNGGILTSNKGITFPGKFHPLPALTAKDRKDLHESLDIGVDAIAVSFVQSHMDIEDAKAEIAKHGVWVPVVAKLERKNAIDDLDAILAVTDAVMVARGDLGLECPISELPVIQKRIIRACRHAQKAVIVATQMLLSMVKNPLPTRAEVTDVANAMLDGADCVMLSEETAIGAYPVDAVRLMKEIGDNAEAYFLERIQGPYAPKKERNPVKYMAYAASLVAESCESAALAVHSDQGLTGRLLSSRRPAHPIFALTSKPDVLHYLTFYWGVRPRLSDASIPNHLERVEKFVEESPLFKKGESVVITAGQPTPGQESRYTNVIKVYYK